MVKDLLYFLQVCVQIKNLKNNGFYEDITLCRHPGGIQTLYKSRGTGFTSHYWTDCTWWDVEKGTPDLFGVIFLIVLMLGASSPEYNLVCPM